MFRSNCKGCKAWKGKKLGKGDYIGQTSRSRKCHGLAAEASSMMLASQKLFNFFAAANVQSWQCTSCAAK
jgi:hypothetical protein